MKLRVPAYGRPVIMLRVENSEWRNIGGDPVAVMRPQLFSRLQDAHPSVLISLLKLHEADRTEPPDQKVDMAVAGQAEQFHFLLQAANSEPGFAPGRVNSGFEDCRDVIDEESSGLDEEPDGKRIAAIERKKMIEIDSPRLGQARMVGDVLVGEPRRPADQAFNLGLLQRRPRYRWNGLNLSTYG